MKRKLAVFCGILALAAFLVLFELRLDLEFSLPGQSTVADPAQEARYEECFAERDREIHAAAFGTIDNPDVQKLYISNHRDEARAMCRERFPERLVTVEEPFRFNLVDLRFRF